MSTLADEITLFILRGLADRLRDRRISEQDVNDDFSLVESGLLDSVGFLELLGRIEREFGLEVDFEGADPDEFTTLGGLARCAARSAPDRLGEATDA